MTIVGWLDIALVLALVVGAAYPLGSFIADLFEGRRTFLSPVLGPVERGLYRLAGVDPAMEQGWIAYTLCMLGFAGGCFVLLYALMRLQNLLPLNPRGFDAVPPDLAFNTAVSFITNANWQAYGGETTMSHLTQMLGLTAEQLPQFGGRYGSRDRGHQGHRARRNKDHRQFLGRSDARDALSLPAALHRRRADLRRARRPADAAGVRRGHDAGRRETGHFARSGGEPGGDQADRHERRRLLQRQLRPSLRKSQPLVEHVAGMVDARRARRVGFRIWAHGRRPSPGPRAALYDGHILPARPLRPLPLGIRRQSYPDVARRRSRARQHGGQGPAFQSGSGVAVRRRDYRNRDRRSQRDLQFDDADRRRDEPVLPADRLHHRPEASARASTTCC